MLRLTTIQVLNDVYHHKQSLQHALKVHNGHENDNALIQELSYGVIRWQQYLEAILQILLQKPLKKKDRLIQYLLLLGLYQIIFTRIPPHAAVSETVNASKKLKKPWATRLINGVLRTFLREQDNILTQLKQHPSAQYAHPDWLLTLLRTMWPQDWQNICHANNQKPPMTLRVNTLKVTRTAYQQQLQQQNIITTSGQYSPQSIQLNHPHSVPELPGFIEGHFAVQDEAAQLATGLLNLAPNMRVLDACSAPGGKACHMLEQYPTLQLLVLDKEASRMQQVTDNLQRLGLQAKQKVADASMLDTWHTKQQTFERILLDTPCSGTGVIRRHPDIKALRTPQNIQQLQQTQQNLLNALWPLLLPGGILLYSTCSILTTENDQQIATFIQQHHNAKLLPINEKWGRATTYGRQILPGEDSMDGFYYSRIEKI